ncbi:MAG TPA: MBL fold metallo-hydrolase RNA specificity domain-containing protein, partial [Tepidisphaeraceae bacterium]|nr:MBL fold metallo-hydrolase RNA specificity domain-containing protein [Tepidisphaeraceae bacterium]
ATVTLAERRISMKKTMALEFGKTESIDANTRVTLRPAGHVLGSAMIHVERDDETFLYTGDYKLRESLTAETAQPVRADVLLCESTFGLPQFKFPAWRDTAARLVELVTEALRAGRQPIVMGYALGKAQEIVKILTDAGLPVTEHGAVRNMSDIYERFDVSLGARRAYDADDFYGKKQLSLEERGVIVAPPQVARAAFTAKFENPLRIMMSGWGMLKGAQFRYGVDHVLPMSDHADFDELLRLIEVVSPKIVYTTHGYRECVDHLRKRGINAKPAEPDKQMLLFD